MGNRDTRRSKRRFSGWRIESFAKCSHKRVWRVDRRLMPGQKRLRVRPGEGEELLVRRLIAAKQALGFERLEIEPIKERSVAIRRRAHSCEVDPVAILANHPDSVCEQPCHWFAGVRVLLVSR